MKKGFTLVELLIIIVIIAILVTLAAPKYQVAMEKGRGLQGVSDIQAISDALNAYYVMHENSFSGNISDIQNYALRIAGTTKNTLFNAPTITKKDNTEVRVSLARDLTDGYTLYWTNQDGQTTQRLCVGATSIKKYCEAIGITWSASAPN